MKTIDVSFRIIHGRSSSDPRPSFYRRVNKMTLPEVEAFAIDICNDWLYDFSRMSKEKLDHCLHHRKLLLNNQFRLTEQEFLRFGVIADLLVEKTEMVFRNTCRIYRQLHAQMHSGDEADFSDFRVMASIDVLYENCKSVWDFEDDSGSDYHRFADILDDFYLDKRYFCNCMEEEVGFEMNRTPDDQFFISEFRCYFDDDFNIKTDWHEWLEHRFPKLKEIPICYTLHQLFDHTHYSLQDIIRINEFVSRVEAHYSNNSKLNNYQIND